MKTFSKTIISVLAAMTIIFMVAAAGIGAETGLSKEKQDELGRVKTYLQNELKVCKEHCAGNKECLEDCDKAYRARLEKEKQRIKISNQ